MNYYFASQSCPALLYHIFIGRPALAQDSNGLRFCNGSRSILLWTFLQKQKNYFDGNACPRCPLSPFTSLCIISPVINRPCETFVKSNVFHPFYYPRASASISDANIKLVVTHSQGFEITEMATDAEAERLRVRQMAQHMREVCMLIDKLSVICCSFFFHESFVRWLLTLYHIWISALLSCSKALFLPLKKKSSFHKNRYTYKWWMHATCDI